MLNAWLDLDREMQHRMAEPFVMASATWGAPPTGNTPPTCSIDTPAGDVTINEGDSINYTGTATDSDGTIAGFSWTFEGGSPAASSVEDPGNVSYATAGAYTTTFSATDDGGASCTPASVQVTVNVVGGNNPPVAVDDSYNTDQDTVLNVAAPGVLGDDSDDDGDAITAVQASSAANGLAILNADGSFSYEPDPGFTGIDSFTYRANDGSADSNLATVTIDVAAPVACGEYTDKASCNAQASCRWDNKNKVCVAN